MELEWVRARMVVDSAWENLLAEALIGMAVVTKRTVAVQAAWGVRPARRLVRLPVDTVLEVCRGRTAPLVRAADRVVISRNPLSVIICIRRAIVSRPLPERRVHQGPPQLVRQDHRAVVAALEFTPAVVRQLRSTEHRT